MDILGNGWAFPIQLDPRGRISLARGSVDVAQAIQMIILTRKGERLMRPEFGCQIHELMFEPNDDTTIGLAKKYIREALAMWEPRIRVDTVLVDLGDVELGTLNITIHYEVSATHDQRALVFPLYNIPGE